MVIIVQIRTVDQIFHHIGESFVHFHVFPVKVRMMAKIVVRHRRHTVVADHTPVLISGVAPYRKDMVHTLLSMVNHRGNHIAGGFWLNNVQQRMFGTVGVPQGENRVIGVSFQVLVDIVVHPAILSVNILIDRGIDHGMVERSVEHRKLIGCAFCLIDA